MRPVAPLCSATCDDGVSAMANSIEDRFAIETELLGLQLLPGQEANLRTAYAALREAVALVGADYPFAAEPAHVFAPAPCAEGRP